MATGQSGQIELYTDIIKDIRIPLPKLTEQQKIVDKIEKLETELFTLNTKIDELNIKKSTVLPKYL